MSVMTTVRYRETLHLTLLCLRRTSSNVRRLFEALQYFKDHCQLIIVNISKQKELDADPGAIQPIDFNEMLDTN